MKVIYSFIILSFCLISVNAQEKWVSLGVGGSFDKHVNKFRENIWFVPGHELSNIMEFSSGLQINTHLSNRFGARLGMNYSRKGFKVTYSWYTPDGTNGSGDPSIPMRTYYYFNYFDIPITGYYSFVNGPWYSLSSSLGILNSILIGTKEMSEMGDGTMKETSFSVENSTFYIPAIRVGLINNFAFSEHWFLSIEPYASYNFGVIDDSYIFESKYTFGGYVSLHYWF